MSPALMVWELGKFRALKCDAPVRGELCTYHHNNAYFKYFWGAVVVAAACVLAIVTMAVLKRLPRLVRIR